MITHVNKENFETEVKNSDVPVVIDFWSPGCRPCQMMGPLFEELSKEYEGKLKFVKLNVEENEELAREFQITGIPATLLTNKGQEVDRFVGFFQKTMLKAKIDFMVARIK